MAAAEHVLDLPCAVPGITVRLYRVDDAIDPTAAIAASALLSVGDDIAVLTAAEVRTLVRRLSEASRILDGNQHTWDPVGQA